MDGGLISRNSLKIIQKVISWGSFAKKLIEGDMWEGPRKGMQDDNMHPPIHPVRLKENRNGLTKKEWKVYEIIVRHFLASVAKDAVCFQTYIQCDIRSEVFIATGLTVEEYNWLEVFPYEKWNQKVLPDLQPGQKFNPSSFSIQQS